MHDITRKRICALLEKKKKNIIDNFKDSDLEEIIRPPSPPLTVEFFRSVLSE